MNIITIVKELMNLKILTESTLMTPELKRFIKTHEDKIIQLDSSEEDKPKKIVMKVKSSEDVSKGVEKTKEMENKNCATVDSQA
tara:strand:- start:177 stop:428 length:252 start_codon:yes stop_codon:yes gene_type:complete